jgi:hypothetical protein
VRSRSGGKEGIDFRVEGDGGSQLIIWLEGDWVRGVCLRKGELKVT